MNFLTSPRGYVQVFENRMVIHVPESGKVVVKSAPFSHKRMVVGDFMAAESLLALGLKEAFPRKLFRQRPQIIMQPKEIIDGGVTFIEQRVLMEVAVGAGARQVKVWLGQDLTTEEIMNFKF